MFEESSPTSLVIFNYFREKYGQITAPIGLLQVQSAISPQINNTLPNLNLIVVAPQGHFKSCMTSELPKILGKKYFKDLGTKITIFAINERYRGRLGKSCLLVNDARIVIIEILCPPTHNN